MSRPTMAEQLIEVLRQAGVDAGQTVTLFRGAGVQGDVAATLRAVLPLVEQKQDRSFLDRDIPHPTSAR